MDLESRHQEERNGEAEKKRGEEVNEGEMAMASVKRERIAEFGRFEIDTEIGSGGERREEDYLFILPFCYFPFLVI